MTKKEFKTFVCFRTERLCEEFLYNNGYINDISPSTKDDNLIKPTYVILIDGKKYEFPQKGIIYCQRDSNKEYIFEDGKMKLNI